MGARSVEQASERILLIRLSAVGDVVNALPTLTLLRRARPNAFIGFAVEDKAAELVFEHPLLDFVHVFRRRAIREALRARSPGGLREACRLLQEHRRELRKARYDIAIDVQGNLKGALHAMASRAPRRIGFAGGYGREASHLLVNERITPPLEKRHRVDKFASLLMALGIAGTEREFLLPASPASETQASRWLGELGLTTGGYLMLHPGTSDHGSDKRWPAESFGGLARRLAEIATSARLPLRALVSWGPGEEDLAREVVRSSGGAALLSPRTDSLLELAALARRAAAFVSGDTGPMHLAAACGTPCVALFGPKDPRVYRPWGQRHRLLHSPPERGGMRAIMIDEVLVEVGLLLGRERVGAALS